MHFKKKYFRLKVSYLLYSLCKPPTFIPMKTKTCLGIALLLSLVTACSSDDKATETLPIKGSYKMASMKSDIAVDLDHNGVASVDMMAEIPYYFDDPRADLNIISNYIDMVDVKLPHCNVYFEYPGEPDGYTTFTSSAFGYEISYDKHSAAVGIIVPEDVSPAYREEFGTLQSLTVLGNGNLQAVIYKKYYDYSSAGWQWLTINATYYKVTE